MAASAEPRDLFAKIWDPIFFTTRNMKDCPVAVVEGELQPTNTASDSSNSVSDTLSYFWGTQDDIPQSSVDEVKEYADLASMKELLDPPSVAACRRGSWLDDLESRNMVNGPTRRIYNDMPMSAATLYRALQAQRFDHDSLPDANRRLIYIEDLDPIYITALAETAYCHDSTILKDAMWKHMAFQPALSVDIVQISLFTMELHLPFFALRVRESGADTATSPYHKMPRQWIDLCFLKVPHMPSLGEGDIGLQQAHFSFIISGKDNGRWLGCAFADTLLDDETLLEHSKSLPSPHMFDPISDFHIEPKLDGFDDPREYFLEILNYQSTRVMREWRSIVRTLARAVTVYRQENSLLLSNDSHDAQTTTADIRKTFDWTQQTNQVLSQLLESLSATLQTWETFNSPNGDIGYFVNIGAESAKARSHFIVSLQHIKRTFEIMEGLKITLLRLEKSCQKTAEALQMRLSVEGSEEVRKNGHSVQFTISIISPVMAATALYAIPTEAAPFKLESKYFMLAVFAIMGIIQVLFVLMSMLPGKVWWRRQWQRGKNHIQATAQKDRRQMGQYYEKRQSHMV